MKAAALLLLHLGLLVASLLPASEKTEAEALRTEVYRLPITSLGEFASCIPFAGATSSNLPADPFAAAPDPDQPVSDHRLTMQQRMERDGIEFPQGGYALLDWDHRALIVRTSEGGHQVVSFWLENLINQQPVSVHLQTHSLEFPATRLPALLSAMRDPKQAATTLRELLSETTQRDSSVQLRQCSLIEMKSGQRGKLESALTSLHTQELTLSDRGVVQVVSTERSIGWTFECDPVLSHDARFIDLNYSRTLTSPPSSPLETRPIGPRFSWPLQDIPRQQQWSSLTLESGLPVLVGHESLRDDPNRIHAFFLTAHSLRIQPDLPPLPANFNPNVAPQEQITRTFTLPTPWPQSPWDEPISSETHLSEKGLELPFASVIQPLKNNRIRVTATREAMTLIEDWVNSEFTLFPRNITFALEVFQVPVAAALPLLEKASASSNHHPLLSHLRTQAAKKQAQRTGYARLEAKSGQRAAIETALQRQRLEKIAWYPGMKPEIETKWTNGGLRAEIDPVLGADGTTIDVTCQLQRRTGPPIQRLDDHQHPALDTAFRLHYDSQPGQTLTSNHTLLEGDTRLIAAWNPVSSEGALQSDTLEFVFLSASATRHVPLHPGITPVPKMVHELFPDPDELNKDSLEQKTFQFDPELFLGSEITQDSLVSKGFAKELQEMLGITSPIESTFVYDRRLNLLTVRNTKQNLKRIEIALNAYREHAPRTLHCETHLFELEATDLFALEKKHPTHPDASALLDALFQNAETGTARLVDSVSLLSKSGQRATSENVLDTPVFNRLKITSQGHPQLFHGNLLAGTRFEIDPIVGSDGQTLDLTFALEHPLSPAQTRVVDLAAPGQPPLTVSLTDHGQAKVQSTFTLISGRARVLAVWRPADAPGTAPSDRLRIAILKAHAP